MLEFAQSLRWQDIFDIMIVSFIIYRVMLLIRGTRAVQILSGIVVLVVLYFAARELEFPCGKIERDENNDARQHLDGAGSADQQHDTIDDERNDHDIEYVLPTE